MKWLVFVLVLINIVRLRGWLRLTMALRGALPPVHAAMGLGDMLIGASAAALALGLLARPWDLAVIRIVRIWSLAAALDLAVAVSVETLAPTSAAGFHDIPGMITLLTTNVAAAAIALSWRRPT